MSERHRLNQSPSTGAPKTSVLESFIAADLASGRAVFFIPPGREELAAALRRFFDDGTTPAWLPADTSVVFWKALPDETGERPNTFLRGELSEEDCRQGGGE